MYSQAYQEKYVNAAKMLALQHNNSQQGIKMKPVRSRSGYGFDGRVRDKKYDRLFDSKFVKYVKHYMEFIVMLSVLAFNFQTLPLLRRTKIARDIWQWLEIFFTINYIMDWFIQLYFYPYYTDDSKLKKKKKVPPTKKQWAYKGYFKKISTYINFLCFVPFFLELIFPNIKYDNFEKAYSKSWIILVFRSFRAIRFFQNLYTSRTTSGKMMNYVILSLKMAYPGIISFIIIVGAVFLFFAGIYYYIEITYCELDENNVSYIFYFIFFILFYFILFYFILFYFILFYFIFFNLFFFFLCFNYLFYFIQSVLYIHILTIYFILFNLYFIFIF